jgi:excisionase family DNA binding protein
MKKHRSVINVTNIQNGLNESKSNEELFTRLPKLLSVEDVCNYLRVGRNTVYELIQSGQLKAKKAGRAYVITENALLNYVKTLES